MTSALATGVNPLAGVLTGIANPTIANVPAALSRGRDRRTASNERDRIAKTRELAGQILGATMGGKLGALAEVNPGVALTMAEKLGFTSDPLERAQHFAGTVQLAATIANSVGPKEALALLVETRGREQQLYGEGSTAILDGMIQMLDSDPQQGTEGLNLMLDSLIEQGLLVNPVQKTVLEIRKEVRADLRKQVKDISKQAAAVETNFNKIQGLTGEISKGNRNASAAAIIALVKLGEPDSTVREGEMIASLNNPNPLAAIMANLKGNGVDNDVINSITATIDPLSPGIVNVKSLLATANALVGANVPVIQSIFAEAQQQGDENLTATGVQSIFTSRLKKRVSGLSDLVKGEEVPEGLPEGTIDNGDGTFTLPTGEKVRPKQ